MNKIVLTALAVVGLGIGLPVACNVINTANSVATAPGRAVQATFQTGNMLSTYEGFFDTKAQYDARVAQIAERVGLVAGEPDRVELQRLRMELSATRQSCRELAARYNADAQKNTDRVFLDRDLPTTLDAAACDATVTG